MTNRELLISTVQHYTSLNRCVDDDKCEYSNRYFPQSSGCAIGRWLKPEDALTIDNHSGGDIANIFESDFINLLPEWMQKMNVAFLTMIQDLHDLHDISFWNEDGINESGIRYVHDICLRFGIPSLTTEEFKHKHKN